MVTVQREVIQFGLREQGFLFKVAEVSHDTISIGVIKSGKGVAEFALIFAEHA